jgi:transposase
MLLRHGRYWDAGSTWTKTHRAWLASQHLVEPAAQRALEHYVAMLTSAEARLCELERTLCIYCDEEPFCDAVTRLAAYRGIGDFGALVIASEICDFARFPTARSFMGFVGLGVCEHSSGESVRRGRLTRSGNHHVRTQLIESAWCYRHRPAIGTALAKRQESVPARTIERSMAAQRRLYARYWKLTTHKSPTQVVLAAVARELAGFLWAEMTSA